MRARLLLTAILLALATSVSAEIPELLYEEGFWNQDYCDTELTTANWDTDVGYLHFHPYEITVAGSYNSPGIAYHLAVAGDVLYLADGNSGLLILDISNPSAPVFLASLNTPGSAYGVDVVGNYAYVADGDHGLQVIDVSDPADPLLAGGVNTPGSAYDVEVSDNYAFVADRSEGLQVIDVSNPYIPVIVADYDTPGNAYGLKLYGDHCYIADGANGLRVINVANPTTPYLEYALALSGYAWDLAAAGGYAYVACDTGGLWVLSLSDPAQPHLVTNFGSSGSALDVTLDGRYLYLSSYGDGLQVIDIADPSSPQLKNDYNTSGSTWSAWPAGEHVYLADGGAGLQVLRFRDDIEIGSMGSLNTGTFLDLEVRGSLLYGVSDDHTLQVIDISDPDAPVLLGGVSGGGQAIDIVGNLAYITTAVGFLLIYDVGSAETPVNIGSLNTNLLSSAMDVKGDLACLANGHLGCDLIDVSDSTMPVPVGTYDPTWNVNGVLLDGDVLYLACTGGVISCDVSTPSSPAHLYSCAAGAICRRLALHGDILYATSFNVSVGELKIFDVSDPGHIIYCLSLPLGSVEPKGLLITGNLLLAVTAESCYGIDISDPLNPVVLWQDSGSGGYSMALAGDYLLSGTDSGLEVSCIYERALNLDDNAAQSIQLNSLDRDIVCAKFWYNIIYPSFNFRLSVDGANFEFVSPFINNFHYFDNPGRILKWSAELETSGSEAGHDPRCQGIDVYWRYDCAFVESVTDVPNDQGGQVSLRWMASGYDHLDSPTPIHDYAVYRLIDPDLRGASPASPKIEQRDGDWHFLGTVPARCDEDYAVVVPTLADSTVDGGLYESVFIVSAMTATPGVFFDSPPDSGYSVDNLAPAVPGGLVLEFEGLLVWEESVDEDFQYFTIYGSEAELLDETATLLAHTTGTEHDVSGEVYAYFHVTATDFSGNEGAAATAAAPTGVADGLPASFVLHELHPNPFNPTTKLHFDLPESEHVSLRIYDQNGRLVRDLLDRRLPAGSHSLDWNGRDDQGHRLASGVYFVNLRAGDFSARRKAVLLK